MIRATNPFNSLLAPSYGVYELRRPVDWAPDPSIWHEMEKKGCTLAEVSSDGRETFLRLEVPHGPADAFGALYWLNRLAGSECLAGLEPFSASPSFGRWRDLLYAHASETMKLAAGERTFTQRFVRGVLSAFPTLLQERIALAVSVEDLGTLDETTAWGNSLAIILMEGAQLKTLAESDKRTWKEALVDRAQRTIRLVGRRPDSAAPVGSVLLTAVGALDRFTWAPRLDPRAFRMYPTPIDPRSANILLWSQNEKQALAIVGAEGHWLHREWETLCRLWKAAGVQ